jgi:hypothetical protein
MMQQNDQYVDEETRRWGCGDSWRCLVEKLVSECLEVSEMPRK